MSLADPLAQILAAMTRGFEVKITIRPTPQAVAPPPPTRGPAERSAGTGHVESNGDGRQIPPPRDAAGASGDRAGRDAPKTGRAFYAWLKDRDEEGGGGLTEYFARWARLNDYPARVLDWSPAQVTAALAEAARRIGANGLDR